MPRHRLLADGAAAWGAGATVDGHPEWPVRCGTVLPIVFDATGWLGAETISGVVWEASPGVVLSGQAATATETRCRAAIPTGTEGTAHTVTAAITSSGGRVETVTVALAAH